MKSPLGSWWAEQYANRHAWAHRANEHFQSKLSADVRQRLMSEKAQEEAYVVVFGRTQVGKTTLILDLMGISDAALLRVSKVLRGGRDAGQSATATAMEYSQSGDDRWSLEESGVVRFFEGDADMASALCDLRQRMEAGALECPAPCRVAIPLGCFVGDMGQPSVRMLDLPGAGASGKREQSHVATLAQRYVPQADLILLVGRGDGLDFLKPEALELPGIEDWQLVPSRFRIVTTFSFTSQSVRDLVRSHSGRPSEAFFRNRLIEQIEKAVPLSEPAKLPRLFFPLEFGHSWQAMESSDSTFHALANNIIQSLKAQLHADIRTSTTPLARIRNAVLAHEVVSRIKEMRQKESLAARSALQTDQRRAEEEVSLLRKARNDAVDSAARLQKRLNQLEQPQLRASLGEPAAQPEYPFLRRLVPPGEPKPSVKDLQSLADLTKRRLIGEVVKMRPLEVEGDPGGERTSSSAMRRFWRNLPDIPASAQHRSVVDDAFSGLEKTLSSYRLDTYWRSSNHQQDIARLLEAEISARKALGRLWRKQWLTAGQRQLKELLRELQLCQSVAVDWEAKLKAGEAKASRIQNALDVLDRRCEEAQRRLDIDLIESRRFRQVLDEAYLDELRERRQAISAEPDPARRLMCLLSALQLPSSRQELARTTD